jgi:hypothetical protein
VVQKPNSGLDRLRTPLNKRSASRRGRYLQKTKPVQQLNIYAVSGIRTRYASNQAASDLHFLSSHLQFYNFLITASHMWNNELHGTKMYLQTLSFYRKKICILHPSNYNKPHSKRLVPKLPIASVIYDLTLKLPRQRHRRETYQNLLSNLTAL